MTTSRAVAPTISAKNTARKENPPDARRLIAALREMGYDSYDSILDLLDNCIDAQAKSINVKVSELKGDIVITIDDDGVGMDEEILDEALRLGSNTERETGDLGKFGLGLVTASIGLSRRVEVYTREDGNPTLYGGFDLDEIAEENRFIKWVQSTDFPAPEEFTVKHGTRIRLSKTDRISNRRAAEFASTLKKRIGQVFRKFLKAGIKITVNNQPVEAIDPLMLADPTTKLVMEMSIDLEGGASVLLRVVELPDYGLAGNGDLGITPQNSGFYIIRNNREIKAAEAFNFYKKHAESSHFRAEISFDGTLDNIFHTDLKKASINPTQSFLDKLHSLTSGLIAQSRQDKRRRANVTRGKIDHSMAEKNITRRTPLNSQATDTN